MNALKNFFVGTIMLFSTSMVLAGCGSDTDSSSNNGGGGTAPAVYRLSDDESYVYRSIIGSILSFKNPSTVSLVTVYQKAIIGRYIRVKATNSYGGYVTNTYRATGSSLVSVDSVSGYSVDSSVSVSLINTALNEYKVSQGLM